MELREAARVGFRRLAGGADFFDRPRAHGEFEPRAREQLAAAGRFGGEDEAHLVRYSTRYCMENAVRE